MKIISAKNDYIPYFLYDDSVDCSINFKNGSRRTGRENEKSIGFSLSSNMATSFGVSAGAFVSIGEDEGEYFLVKDQYGYKMFTSGNPADKKNRLYVRIPLTEEAYDSINPMHDVHMVGVLIDGNIRIERIK